MPPNIIKVAALLFRIAILVLTEGCHKETTTTINSTIDDRITYTDLIPDSVILVSQTDTFKLDLNSDGITDFEFHRFRIKPCEDAAGGIAYAIDLSLKPTSGNNAIMIRGSNLLLDSSITISKYSPWTADSVLLLVGTVYAIGHCRSYVPPVGSNSLLHVSDKYLGLEFNKDNDVYYGWVRFSSTYTRDTIPYIHLIDYGQIILKDYAFNSNPNQPILAGQKP